MTEALVSPESSSRRNDVEPVTAPRGESTSESAARRVTRMFEAESDFVWRLLSRFGVPAADVEDLTHEVFITAFRRLDAYDPSRPLRPWLFGIAYRIAMRFRALARNSRELMTDTDFQHAADQVDQDDSLHARRVLHDALDGLSMEQRAVFVMHDMEGWSMPELAEALSIPLNTGYSRLRLARAEVKERVLSRGKAEVRP